MGVLVDRMPNSVAVKMPGEGYINNR